MKGESGRKGVGEGLESEKPTTRDNSGQSRYSEGGGVRNPTPEVLAGSPSPPPVPEEMARIDNYVKPFGPRKRAQVYRRHLRKALEEKQVAEQQSRRDARLIHVHYDLRMKAQERAEQAERRLEAETDARLGAERERERAVSASRLWRAKWQVMSDDLDKRNDQLTDARAENTKLREFVQAVADLEWPPGTAISEMHLMKTSARALLTEEKPTEVDRRIVTVRHLNKIEEPTDG